MLSPRFVAPFLACLLAGCGGTESSAGDHDASADAPVSDTGLVDHASADDGAFDAASNDGTTSGDESIVVDGGAPSDPGNIQCNGAACATSTNYCCVDVFDGGQRCVPDTVSSCSGERRTCDERADCMGASVCCSALSQARPPRFALLTDCAPSCDPQAQYQLCKTAQECPTSQPCTAQMCGHYGVVQVCGTLPPGACQ